MAQAEYGRVEPLFTPLYVSPIGIQTVTATVVDSNGTYAWVSEITNNHIWRITLATGALLQMDMSGTTISSPYALALDEIGQQLYVFDNNLRNIYRLTLSNGVVSPPLNTPIAFFSAVRGMVLDSTRHFLYATDYNNAHVYQMSLTDGTLIQIDVGYTWSHPWGIWISPDNSVLYVSDISANKILTITVATQAVARLDVSTSGLNQPRTVQLDSTGTVLYVADWVSRAQAAHHTSIGIEWRGSGLNTRVSSGVPLCPCVCSFLDVLVFSFFFRVLLSIREPAISISCRWQVEFQQPFRM
jgi:DNA-binding beta-propeller fold protein YncE